MFKSDIFDDMFQLFQVFCKTVCGGMGILSHVTAGIAWKLAAAGCLRPGAGAGGRGGSALPKVAATG